MTTTCFENEAEIRHWLLKDSGKLKVSNEYFFNNANIILSQDEQFRNQLICNLIKDVKVKTTIRTKKKDKKKYKGIKIGEFNKSLRMNLKIDDNLLFEVYNDDGIFYTSNGSKGFDFAKIDTEYNLIRLWNLCFGEKSLYNGEYHWNETLKKNKFIQEAVKEIGYNPHLCDKGKNQNVVKKTLTILGELQFGNWGLLYRDLFKLLHADANSGVDLFVYVTADNRLLDYASDGIVSYEKTVNILKEFSSLIKVPIWVIGLDIDIL